MKILIVEDEPSLREIMVRTLTREQYIVEQAADYAAALDKIAAYDYDCILLDIMLPDGSGLKLLEELKRRGIENATVSQTGCVGVCRLEPIVEVYVKGQEKVTYVHMTPEKVARVVNDHIVNGRPVEEYTVGAQG